jgi:hypothetical protein
MCTEHWRAYRKGVRKAREAAKVADEGVTGSGGEADAA